MHSFTIGQEYVRSQLLEFIGSRQPQTGVIWGAKEPGCIIVTSGGRHGKKAGYTDEILSNGCWWYFGQGQSGDHSIANPANKKLISGQQSIFLFSTREPNSEEVKRRGNYKKLFSYQGAFNVSGFDYVIPDSGTRKGNKLLRFLLVPVRASDTVRSDDDIEFEFAFDSIFALREEIIEQARPTESNRRVTAVEYQRRSIKLRRYAILRAKNQCEGCNSPPPFLDELGIGYFEVHHIFRLADDGVDAPENVAAICPNCHRRAHHSVDRELFRRHLLESILKTEEKFASSININIISI